MIDLYLAKRPFIHDRKEGQILSVRMHLLAASQLKSQMKCSRNERRTDGHNSMFGTCTYDFVINVWGPKWCDK